MRWFKLVAQGLAVCGVGAEQVGRDPVRLVQRHEPLPKDVGALQGGGMRCLPVGCPHRCQVLDTPVEAFEPQQREVARGQREVARGQREVARGQREGLLIDIRANHLIDLVPVQIGQGAEEVRAPAKRVVEHTRTAQALGPADGETSLEEFAGEPEGKGRVTGTAHEDVAAGVVGVITSLAGK